MKEKLKQWFGEVARLSAKATTSELRTLIQKVLEDLPAEGEISAEEGTLGEMLGLAPAETPVAAPEVLTELGLEPGATLAQVQAKVGELRAPAGMVAKAELDRVSGELAKAKSEIERLSAKSLDEQIDALISANRAKVPPAREEWFRGVAKRHGIDHATEVVAAMKAELPADQGSSAPADDETPETLPATRVAVAGRGDLEVDPASATLAAKVRKIQKEKGCDYRTAHAELKKREAAEAV